MLTHITINNFTLVEHLDLDLKRGMTAITGETGTGKSILLDALAMTLGERADADRVRYGAQRADITATFSLDDLPKAQEWLINNDLNHADECLLKRTITTEGRSRSFINAQPATLQQVRALGELLIDIHSQHAHQSLLLKTTHQRLLDEYAQHQPLLKEVSELYQKWQTLQKEFITLRDNAAEMQAKYQLLHYQVEELDQLNVEPGEIEQLEEEQILLTRAESILYSSQQLADTCNNDEHGLQQRLQQALRLLSDMETKGTSLRNAEQLLNHALIHIEEAYHEIRHQMDTTALNPERLQEVSERLSACYNTARKHHIRPEELIDKHKQLNNELSKMPSEHEHLSILEEKAEQAAAHFHKKASSLSKKRHKAAQKLTKAVNQQLSTLSMNNANVQISLCTDIQSPTANGIDQIEFLISTNPGHPHKPLGKIASGGELSRISLAIQVATAQTSKVATLVFDEVDVGIGGSTADVVGQLLANLGSNSQVLCVTHLAQVASKAHQHWQVSKYSQSNQTASTITELNQQCKIEEIARMISGSELSKQSLAHARLMLEETAD
ncbi:DNA repair protein RecN [Candidatus Endobugula sertula]|uniref:DNA repair protein RecN n=1 Tax=Candidatus Endobugula sertula TaxID=62101 RepID=A0A1D2QS74_9GAMM|nr:DNA repair protein RecN [Candidatus Endobugula sertula]